MGINVFLYGIFFVTLSHGDNGDSNSLEPALWPRAQKDFTTMAHNTISNREMLANFANLFNTYGEGTIHTYAPNGKQFQILRKYREEHESRTTGLKTLFDVAILEDGKRTEYNGKPSTFFAGLISGEKVSTGRTRKSAPKQQTPAEVVESLKAEMTSLKERQREITEMVGKVGKELDWAGYQARLEAEERAKHCQTAMAEMSIEELLAEVARRQAEQAQPAE